MDDLFFDLDSIEVAEKRLTVSDLAPLALKPKVCKCGGTVTFRDDDGELKCFTCGKRVER